MEANIKIIESDWVLLTFDIPQNKPKVRKRVLKRIHELGGMPNTDSVYLIPYSDETLALANDLSSDAEVVVWKSRQEDEKKALTLTIQYDKHVMERCNVIGLRLIQIKDHIEQGRLGIANRMILKTVKLLNQVKDISKTFCPEWLEHYIENLDAGIKQIHD